MRNFYSGVYIFSCTVILYVIGLFVSGNPNPATWHEFGKIILAICWVVAVITIITSNRREEAWDDFNRRHRQQLAPKRNTDAKVIDITHRRRG